MNLFLLVTKIFTLDSMADIQRHLLRSNSKSIQFPPFYVPKASYQHECHDEPMRESNPPDFIQDLHARPAVVSTLLSLQIVHYYRNC